MTSPRRSPRRSSASPRRRTSTPVNSSSSASWAPSRVRTFRRGPRTRRTGSRRCRLPTNGSSPASRAARWWRSRDRRSFQRRRWRASAGASVGTCPFWECRQRSPARCVCALVLENARLPRRWPQPLVERLQLISEILGAALQRRRHENALRSSVAEIERLNARLEADNVYLKEEIKSYHDFDDIVGESAPLRLALARLAQVAPTNSSVLLTGPDGNRQGTVRPRAARTEPAACPSARAGQLCRASADARRKRTLRP